MRCPNCDQPIPHECRSDSLDFDKDARDGKRGPLPSSSYACPTCHECFDYYPLRRRKIERATPSTNHRLFPREHARAGESFSEYFHRLCV